jgi:hypothetical protein
VISTVVTFFVVSLATAFVCTAVKEDEDVHLLKQTFKLLQFMVLAIGGFALVVQLVTALAR